MMDTRFLNTFSTPLEKCASIANIVTVFSEQNTDMSILDIGCGTGGIALSIADRLSRSNVTGIDICPRNVEQARKIALDQKMDYRVSFMTADYLHWNPARQFDMILSVSTLQNISADTTALFGKIFSELSDNGRLLCTLPFDCSYNKLLWGMRKVFRAFRGTALDNLILKAGIIFGYGKSGEKFIRERIPYMYMLPYCYDSNRFRLQLNKKGLIFLYEQDEPHASLVQPKHKLLVFRKTVT